MAGVDYNIEQSYIIASEHSGKMFYVESRGSGLSFHEVNRVMTPLTYYKALSYLFVEIFQQ